MHKIILITLLSFLTLSSLAQNKIGFIDSDELMSLIPERKEAGTILQEFTKGLESELGSMTAQYQKSLSEYQANEATYTDLIKHDKINKINMLEQRIQSFKQHAQEALQIKEQELLEPILLKIRRAIEDVAKENNFTCIFDKSQGPVLYSIESESILPLVKKKLSL